MRHFPGDTLEDIEWIDCVHKPTKQQYAILKESVSVETEHGTMTARVGDCLMKGVDKKTVYVLTRPAFKLAYVVKKRRS